MRTYRKYFIINEEPELVFQALTTENTIRLWSGAKADFKAVPGSEFELYNGTIVGQNLLLEVPHELVQQWYLQEIDKAEDASLVSFKLHPHKKGTSLLLEHTNIPEDQYAQITEGWETQFMYDLIDFYKS